MVVACCSHKTLPFATCKCVDYNGKIEFYDLSAMLRVRVNTESRKKMGTIRVTMCKGGFFLQWANSTRYCRKPYLPYRLIFDIFDNVDTIGHRSS